MNKRRIVIGDIHGDLDGLREILAQALDGRIIQDSKDNISWDSKIIGKESSIIASLDQAYETRFPA
jgi:hypothetical protein